MNAVVPGYVWQHILQGFSQYTVVFIVVLRWADVRRAVSNMNDDATIAACSLGGRAEQNRLLEIV
ncbi:hypothetical protein D3C80_2093150 [compost metagenome]